MWERRQWRRGQENTLAACSDGVDNDGDAYVDCDDQDCSIFAVCAGGDADADADSCTDGLVDCGDGTCRDLESDDENCGRCGALCDSRHACDGGDCVCIATPAECGEPYCGDERRLPHRNPLRRVHARRRRDAELHRLLERRLRLPPQPTRNRRKRRRATRAVSRQGLANRATHRSTTPIDANHFATDEYASPPPRSPIIHSTFIPTQALTAAVTAK